MTDELDPQRTLQNFFLLDRALAFHDQTRPSGCYTYGNYTPQVVQETPAGKISSLHLLTSPGGGLATFIAPKLPVDRAAIEDYIRRHFVPAPETITLEQEEIQQSLWLHFAQRPAAAAYSVEFEQSKMALTHEESGRLAGAIQGTKTRSIFSLAADSASTAASMPVCRPIGSRLSPWPSTSRRGNRKRSPGC